MDQAKWSIPRDRANVTPKGLSNTQRPKFKIQACWLHGTLLKLWLLDPRLPADASSVLETMTRSIEQAVALCQARNKPVPDQLLCWATGFAKRKTC